jgi:predicted nucleic acid-binding protein
LAEACFLLKTLAPLELVVRGLLVLSFTLQAEVVAVTALMEKYADVPMSLADACLVRMVEMGLGSKVLTLDSDFRIYRQGNRRVIPVDMPDDL